MMAKRINVAAVMAVSLFFLLGCGQPPNMVDADAGPDIMDDGGVDADSGVPPNPNDGGMPDADGGGGDTCTPSQSDPLCSSSTECVCDVSGIDCDSYPSLCQRIDDARNYCVPGRNRCGVDMPLSMESYMGLGPMADCLDHVNFDVWFDGSETTVQSFRRNNQLIIRLGGWGEFTCSHEGKCYQLWSYEGDPENAPFDGAHAWFEIEPDCRGIRGESYNGWLGQTEPDDYIALVYRRDS